MLKLTRTGLLLFLPIACALIGTQRGALAYLLPGNHAEARVELGSPPWASWGPGFLELRWGAVPRIAIMLILPLVLGMALERWRRWRVSNQSLWVFAALAVICLGGGMGTSLLFWGYAWTPPSLDSRTREVHWSAVGSFRTSPGSPAWTPEPRSALAGYRRELAPDHECCADGRILAAIEARTPLDEVPSMPPAMLAQLQEEALERVRLEVRGPEHAPKLLRGVAASGSDAKLGEVAFVSLTYPVRGDTYANCELLWQRPGGAVLSTRQYVGDIAGEEYATAPVVATLVFIVGLPCAALLVLAITLVRALADGRPRDGSERSDTRSPGELLR